MAAECMETIYKPTMQAMKAEGRPFVGILFVGLMMTPKGIKVLEYNARFGDPETQVVLPRMKSDLIDVIDACLEQRLDKFNLEFDDNAAVCVVLASNGYPEHYEKGFAIEGLENFNQKEGYYVFHAGTKSTENGIVTNGGRVLGVSALGENLTQAKKNAYHAVNWIEFENKYYRSDIGKN
jgi:phosphoribosylamine--glycine ligase